MADWLFESDQKSWTLERRNARRPSGPIVLPPQVVHAVLVRVRPLRFVVAADAEVAVREPGQVVGKAQRLIERERVVHLTIDKEVVVRRSEPQCPCLRAIGQRHIQVGCVVGVDAKHVEVERALVPDEPAAHAEAVVEILFGAPGRHERAAAAQRVVPEPEGRVVTNRSQARLRDDFDRHPAGAMVLRGKLVARDADRSDLRFGGQGAALEAIDADDRAGARHILSCCRKWQDRRTAPRSLPG